MTPVIAMFAPQQVSILLPLLGTLLLVLNPVTGFWPLKTQSYLLPLAFLVMLGFLSGFWAVEPAGSGKAAGSLLLLLAAGTLLLTHARELARSDRHLVGWAMTNGYLVLIVLFVTERLTGAWLLREVTGIDATATQQALMDPALFLALLSWPVAGFLWSVDRLALAVSVLVATPLVLIGDVGTTALIILAAGWIFSLPAMVLPMLSRVFASFCAVLCVVALPIAAGSSTAFEAAYRMAGPADYDDKRRLFAWHFMGQRIVEQPMLGWGMDSSHHLPGRDQRIGDFAEQQKFTFMGEKTRSAIGEAAVLSSGPAGIILQTQLELGLPGLVAVMVFAVMAIAAASVNGPWMIRASRMALLMGIVIAACIASASLHGGWLAALFMLAIFGAALPAIPARERQERDVPENSVVNPSNKDEEDDEAAEGYPT